MTTIDGVVTSFGTSLFDWDLTEVLLGEIKKTPITLNEGWENSTNLPPNSEQRKQNFSIFNLNRSISKYIYRIDNNFLFFQNKEQFAYFVHVPRCISG